MNKGNYKRLRLKVKLGFLAMTLVSILLAAYPLKLMTSFLVKHYSIVVDAPIKAQTNSTEFLLVVLLVGTIVFLLSAALVAFVVSKWNGWSNQQSIDYLLRYENLPSHWLKR